MNANDLGWPSPEASDALSLAKENKKRIQALEDEVERLNARQEAQSLLMTEIVSSMRRLTDSVRRLVG